ncbi:MAG: MBL fold metallo-hydrolase [Flavobacteriales bacterium]|nr:MBL fold metallo-hydrolase [Flavobacteriales bacterium]
MRITFLGTGTSQGVPMIGCDCAVCKSADPRDNRLRVSVLVETKGKRILIDAGPDLRQQMLRSGTTELDAVLLTHEHMDHIVGMDDLRAFSFKHQPSRAVPIYADEPTMTAVRRVFSYAFAEKKYPGVPKFDLRTIGREPFEMDGIGITPVEVMHMHMPVLGFRVGGFTYITDAKTIAREQLDKIRGSEILVLNALRHEEHYSHLNIKEALAIVQEVRPEQAYFTHVSHLMGLHAESENYLPPNVRIAHDGLVVELQEP